MSFSTFLSIITALITINSILAIITIFRKPRSIASIFAWLMVLVFLPGIGFFTYLFLGRGIDKTTVHRFEDENREDLSHIAAKIAQNNSKFKKKEMNPQERQLKRYFNNVERTPLCRGNDVKFFLDGQSKFKALFEDIRRAKSSVHVEYYAFFPDKIGTIFRDHLIDKAREGVEVRVIYDPWGGHTRRSFFKPLEEAGGKVIPFITARDVLRNTRLNYHLHRKIVVIDGQIGWTGGFNVGDQYIYGSKKFGFWRDTHGRITGTGAFGLQETFIRDWNVSVKRPEDKLKRLDQYFVVPKEGTGDVDVQIVSNGPENPSKVLRTGFIKMIMDAEDYIWIQSPYLIPDDPMITALVSAAKSGVDVRIMIPDMPDHPFIFRATQYYANFLHKHGVKIYNYTNGFIHSKTLVTDDKLGVFGTSNQDIRSYELNFEMSAFCYDEDIARQMAETFKNDIKKSELLTDEIIANQSLWLRFRQNFSRLLSPIL
ncbi:cardiolipin synthase [Streptococcaceae bacterium ESL0729]|nr:cardiolipin synthase [Streptococcaceae bacterium ESL0729]